MRPKHYKREYAVAQTVADMQRRFVYPDEDTKPGPPLILGGGGAPTVVVAAANASDFSKGLAHFQCAGINDDQTIQHAYEVMGEIGRVLLTEGTFQCAGDTINFDDDGWLQGCGTLATVLRFQSGAASGGSLVTSSRTSEFNISHLTLEGFNTADATGIFLDNGADAWVRDVWFTSLTYGVYVATNFVDIADIRCQSASVAYPVYVDGAGYRDISIKNSHYLTGTLYMANAVNVSIKNNHGYFGIYGTDARGWSVLGNSMFGNVFEADAIIDLSQDDTGDLQDPGCLIEGNITEELGAPAFIRCDGVERLSVVNNLSTFGCIYILNCEGFVCSNNNAYRAIGEDSFGGNDIGAFHFENCNDGVVQGNSSLDGSTGGFYFENCDRLTVTGNSAYANIATHNTYDNFQISGNRNRIFANSSHSAGSGSEPRYGLNVLSGDCNIVVGNDLGDPADYGTDALNDAGTNTQLTYPSDATYGDNFTVCGSPTSP